MTGTGVAKVVPMLPARAPNTRPPSRVLRAWLLAQAAVYALAAAGAAKQAIATTRPIVATDLQARSSLPWLREFVLVVGLVLAGVGVILAHRSARHPDDRNLPAAPDRLRPALRRLGRVGGMTRGIMFLLPGLIVVVEAWAYRPGSFGRVSEEIRTVLQEPGGRLVLGLAAVGLAAFAGYELAAAVYRREPPDGAAASVPARPRGRFWWVIAAGSTAGAAALWGLLTGVGHLVETTGQAAGGSVDRATVTWFASHRTPVSDRLSAIAGGLASTMACLTVTAAAVVVLVLWLGRWRESAALVLATAGELFVFVLVTAAVHRPRPMVVRLDAAPPTSSFPSGHTGAAVTVYGFLAVIALRELHRRRLATVSAAVLASVPVAVGLSRMYRGMHFPSDVLAGGLAGAGWLALVLVLVLHPLWRLQRSRPPATGSDRASWTATSSDPRPS